MRLSLFVSKRFISNVDELRFILSKAYFSYLGTLMYVASVAFPLQNVLLAKKGWNRTSACVTSTKLTAWLS